MPTTATAKQSSNGTVTASTGQVLGKVRSFQMPRGRAYLATDTTGAQVGWRNRQADAIDLLLDTAGL